MKVLYDAQTATVSRYPRDDDAPIIGLDPRYTPYQVVLEAEPNYNPETQFLTSQDTLDHKQKKLVRGWIVNQLVVADPGPGVPIDSITKLQRNLWLATKGLYEPATRWINRVDDQTLIRQIYWRDAETTKIDDPITIALAEELGLKTREQRVAAFREASKIG